MGNMKDIGLLDCEDRPSIEENFKRVQGGGGGGASDWNASEGEDGYIKNRTHYEQTIVHDSVTEVIVDSPTVSNVYGSLPNYICNKSDVVMPEGKYILIQLGGEKHKVLSLPPSSGGSRPVYRETITLDNGVTVRAELSNYDPATGKSDRELYFYRVIPITDEALTPYMGQTYSVMLCEDELKQLDPKFLPDGYPYETIEEKSGECPAMVTPDDPPFVLEGFPAFDVGDTVKVKVNGVDYSLVALDGGGFPFIGDDPSVFFDGNAGEYGWVIAYVDREVSMYSYTSCTVSWEASVVVQVDGKFLPLGGFKAICIYEINYTYRCNMSFEEMWSWMKQNHPTLFPYLGVFHGVNQAKYNLLNNVFRRNGDNGRYIELCFYSTDGRGTQTTFYYLEDGTITENDPER